MDTHVHLSRRECEIMDILYARGQASTSDVLEDMPDALARASVRTMLPILEEKGHLRHKKEGREFIYEPIKARKVAVVPVRDKQRNAIVVIADQETMKEIEKIIEKLDKGVNSETVE